MKFRNRLALAIVLGCYCSLPTLAADEIDEHLAAIAQTGRQGAGSEAARQAVRALSSSRPEVLPRLLAAMDTDNPVAANWYRSAYEAIVERTLAMPGEKVPVDEIRRLANDRNRRGRVRRLALALCDRLEPGYATRTIRGMLDDPEFRADAVELALAAGGEALSGGDSETARDEFQKAFAHARQSTQVTSAAAGLAKLGEQVDIARHLGLMIDWWVVGPFDAPEFSGYAKRFAPESAVELKATYEGQNGASLAWRRYHTSDPLGLVDLVQAIAPAKEAVGYAFAQIESPRAQSIQLRCGADDNLAVWLNGEKVFGREQWLNGSRFDRFVAPVKLVQGTNRVLVKICQGPQHVNPDVPNNWTFQLRFCDEQGAGVPFTSAMTMPGEAK